MSYIDSIKTIDTNKSINYVDTDKKNIAFVTEYTCDENNKNVVEQYYYDVINKVKHGEYKKYIDDKLVVKCYYENGKKNKKYIVTIGNFQKIATFIDDELCGDLIHRRNDKIVLKSQFNNGKEYGLCRYIENNTIVHCPYVDGKKHGMCISYKIKTKSSVIDLDNIDGLKICKEIIFVDGKKHGLSKEYVYNCEECMKSYGHLNSVIICCFQKEYVKGKSVTASNFYIHDIERIEIKEKIPFGTSINNISKFIKK
jgi:hypothetical protein